ncbi:uroporphyrinogen decarboxylase family protein [Chloroflexota bacterium]
MTGKRRIEAALSPEGARDIPAVVCYEGIFTRDHWPQLTNHPWWYQDTPDIRHQVQWRLEVAEQLGQDMFYLPSFFSPGERRDLAIKVRADGVFRVNRRTGEQAQLTEPAVGGWSNEGSLASNHPEHWAETPDEIDELMSTWDQGAVDDSQGDLAAALLDQTGEKLYPYRFVSTPLWVCYDLWGFEGMMVMIASKPALVEHACRRNLEICRRAVRQAASLGAAGLWIEDCFSDMISPAAFEAFNVRFLKPVVEEIRALGMNSLHYFCGNPSGKWDQILSIGADALALEESKKGFNIDIEDIVSRVEGRTAVFGNLDAIGVLQDGSEEQLRAEIARQIEAGRRNGGRFIMGIGSPVTPGTSVERVRLYCDLAHEFGAI